MCSAVATPAASAQKAARARTAAWARLEAVLAALAAQPRSGPPAGYWPGPWHTLAEPTSSALDNPATDPDRWLGFL